MRIFSILIVALLFLSCETEDHSKLKRGHYRATLDITQEMKLPFNLKVNDQDEIEIYNADEVIVVDEILYENDSIRINFPVYEGYISGKFENGNIVGGQYIKESLNRYVPFELEFDNEIRFLDAMPTDQSITGVWEMEFTEEDGSRFIGKGIFEQNENLVTGTIRTTCYWNG